MNGYRLFQKRKEVYELSRLKDLRIKRGYTQIKMQHLTGIDQSDYSKIENNTGKVALIGLENITKRRKKKKSP